MAIKKEDFYKKKDEYYPEPTCVTEYPEGTVAWYSPIITPEERERRMNEIKKATANFMRYVLSVEEQKAREQNKGDLTIKESKHTSQKDQEMDKKEVETIKRKGRSR